MLSDCHFLGDSIENFYVGEKSILFYEYPLFFLGDSIS